MSSNAALRTAFLEGFVETDIVCSSGFGSAAEPVPEITLEVSSLHDRWNRISTFAHNLFLSIEWQAP
jgi:hypothetical protein